MTKDWLIFTDGPLLAEERLRLLTAVWHAQRSSAMNNRQNASNTAAVNSAVASFSLTSALASAILATGGVHAPVTQARVLLFRTPVPDKLPEERVPGFGNSFFKARIDPAWQPVSDILKDNYATLWGILGQWSQLFKLAGKTLFPNAAAFTAAIAELVHWPLGQELVMVIQPRITVWTAMAACELDLWRTNSWEH